MSDHQFEIVQQVPYRIGFTHYAFDSNNSALIDLIAPSPQGKVLVFVEKVLLQQDESLQGAIETYFSTHLLEASLFMGVKSMKGGEKAKNDFTSWLDALSAISQAGLDRHSTILVVGGGALLDVIGFAAATAHRGIRLVRLPSTTLSQADSGVGVKNGINYEGQKNYLGTFAVPWATLNDFTLLHSQPEELKRAGLVEIVKVALIKDEGFFVWLENNHLDLYNGVASAMEHAVEKSALLHAKHIAEGGDPFEQGSSRPLDFGHWAAHYLETLSDYRISHAEAVAVGICLDVLYSAGLSWLNESDAKRIITLIRRLGFQIFDPLLLKEEDGELCILRGLESFREHLGGELTVLMLQKIGQGCDVHVIDHELMAQCINTLSAYSHTQIYEIGVAQ